MEIFGLGVPEIVLILVVFLLFFGKDKLPQLARSVGRSFNELKAGFKDGINTEPENSKPTAEKKDISKNK